MRYYISIEENIEVFELYKPLWLVRGIDGIRASNMDEGIEKAVEVEKSTRDELYFIAIAADDIDYMPQLKVLSEETNAPILIATSAFNAKERARALDTGADFYGEYCETTEENIVSVIAAINSIDRRIKKQKPLAKVIIYGGITLAPSHRNRIFLDEKEISLYKIEFDILYYFVDNRGRTLTHDEIYEDVWGVEYDESAKKSLWAAVGRLRDKLRNASGGRDYIETVRDVGYRFPLVSDK